MVNELKYKGYATEPSDYECPDGQLAMSLNLINEDEQLKPLFQPATLADMPQAWSIVFIHSTPHYTHYIIRDDSQSLPRLLWIDTQAIDDAQHPVPAYIVQQLAQPVQGYTGEYTDIRTIGNTLIILTSTGLHYILWKNQTYNYLGTHIPELPITFGLQADKPTYGNNPNRAVYPTTYQDTAFETHAIGNIKFEDGYKVSVNNHLKGLLNKLIADYATGKGRFMMPFFIRYAFRLYDGASLVMHSAPVLMKPSTKSAPLIVTEENNLSGNNTRHACAWAIAWDLDFACDQQALQQLKQWSDIVKGVDVFITPPIYTYDQAGEIDNYAFVPSTESLGYAVGRAGEEILNERYKIHEVRDLLTTYHPVLYVNGEMGHAFQNVLRMPVKDEDEIIGEIKAAANFYLLKSFELDDLTHLPTERKRIEIPDDYLQSLVARERLVDDYQSHDTIIAETAFVYNSRVNLAGVSRIRFGGFPMNLMLPYVNQGFNTADEPLYQLEMQGSTEVVTPGNYGQFNSNLLKGAFLFFPATDCNMMATDIQGVQLPMKKHDFLNGSYYFEGLNAQAPATTVTLTPSAETAVEHTPEKIYTSEVNNPFYFPLYGINTIPSGERIMALSSATKALSEGQFGQFPLYAFTEGGIWALEPKADGSYSAKSATSRDVCTGPASVTQIDDAVLFASRRGIMLLRGSDTQCITDSIFSEAPFNVLDLPGIDQLHAKLGHSADACLPVKPFLAFLEGCKMVYDYVHQRIFVYNPTKANGSPKYTYAYVFSLKSKMWGMVCSNLASTINAYPDAKAMTQSGQLVSFDAAGEQVCKGLFVTRPLKLEAADVHKTISAIIQRGHFRRGDVATVLYGSRDLYTWHLVWSSKDHYLRGFSGTPYKYFRIAALATLVDGQSVFGASVKFEQRHTNNLR